MKMYLYKEYRDDQAYGEEITKIFGSRDEAGEELRKRVEDRFQCKLEELANLVDEGDTVTNNYVSIEDGDDTLFYVVEEKEIETEADLSAMITVSSAHITKETADLLAENKLDLAVFPKGGYGWYIACPDINDRPNDLPLDLYRLLDLAYVYNCGILCIDGEGKKVIGFPEYDW